MFIRAELKQQAKDQLRGRWAGAVGAFLLVALIEVVMSCIPYAGQIASLILSGPLMAGLIIYCIHLINTNDKLDVDVAFKGFSIFGPTAATYLWMLLWTFLWSLLFIIPGIIKAYAYSQSLYIIAENPDIGARQALKTSMLITGGYKWRVFVMQLSFLGWHLLCMLSLFIGYLWLMPYLQLTLTNMYYKLKELGFSSGACTPADFGVEG